MASNTTNLGLRKPAVSENWSVQDDFNANMDRIDSFVGDCVNANQGGVSSASGLSDLLDSMLSSLRYNGVKAFQMNVATSFSYFSVATYICTLYKSTSNTTYATATFRRIDQPIVIDGARNANGWSFNSLSSKLTPTKITLTAMEGVTIDNQDCYTVGKILYVAMRFTINTARDAYANLFQLPNAYFASDVTIPVFTQYNGLVTSNPSSIYADKGSSMLRNLGYTMPTGTYKITATLLIQ